MNEDTLHERERCRSISMVRRKELAKRLSISPATLWRWVRSGHFPRPIRLGENSVGWREAQVTAWLNERAGSDAKP